MIITIDYTTAHIATLRPSLLASRTFPLDCGVNASQPIFERGRRLGDRRMPCAALAVLIANAMTSWDGQRAKGERLTLSYTCPTLTYFRTQRSNPLTQPCYLLYRCT